VPDLISSQWGRDYNGQIGVTPDNTVSDTLRGTRTILMLLMLLRVLLCVYRLVFA